MTGFLYVVSHVNSVYFTFTVIYNIAMHIQLIQNDSLYIKNLSPSFQNILKQSLMKSCFSASVLNFYNVKTCLIMIMTALKVNNLAIVHVRCIYYYFR